MTRQSLRSYIRDIESLLVGGLINEVKMHCNNILRSFPRYLETYSLLGKAYLEIKQYDKSDEVFQKILTVLPNDFEAHVGRSIISEQKKLLDQAVWHMERAFEIQPSNTTIQGELQRLYGRRDGVQPPRIRMTRGALARMYVQGGLYPQAISEIKYVLAEDPNRFDLKPLLAIAYYRSGNLEDAKNISKEVIGRYPYNLDANRVLADIYLTDKSLGNVQAYRQRVIELDPYAAFVRGSIFSSVDVPDHDVTIERWVGKIESPINIPLADFLGSQTRDTQVEKNRFENHVTEATNQTNFMATTVKRALRVFICHSSADKIIVRELFQRLLGEGWIDPWLDEEKLLPGQDWDIEIEKAVEFTDAVIVCLSNNSVSKEGYIQRELRFVLDIALTKPEETIFIIPIRLDNCQPPRRLRPWQYEDYYPEERREKAYVRLSTSLKVRARTLGIEI